MVTLVALFLAGIALGALLLRGGGNGRQAPSTHPRDRSERESASATPATSAVEQPTVRSPEALAGTGGNENPRGELNLAAGGEADPQRFEGQGELRGHVELDGGGPFPTRWTLVLSPSATLVGRERATEREIEFTAGEQDFHVRDLPLAGYDVSARAAGLQGVAYPVLLDRATPNPFINLRLSPAGFVTGRILDHDGLPAEGVPITLLELPDNRVRPAETDAAGIYRIEPVVDGAYELLIGHASSPILSERRSLRVSAPGLSVPDMELPPLAELEILVQDTNGTALVDAVVRGSGNRGGLIEGRTDVFGLLKARYLPGGRYRVHAEYEGYADRRISIELLPGDTEKVTLSMIP